MNNDSNKQVNIADILMGRVAPHNSALDKFFTGEKAGYGFSPQKTLGGRNFKDIRREQDLRALDFIHDRLKQKHNFAGTALNSLGFGLGNPAMAASGALKDKVTGNKTPFGELFGEYGKTIEDEQNNFRQKHPGLGVISEVMGMLAPGGMAYKPLAKGARVAVKKAPYALDYGRAGYESVALMRALNKVKRNPFAGKAEDIMATIRPYGGDVYNIARGGIAKDPITGEFLVSGKRLNKYTPHFGNFGFTKSIFKHNMGAWPYAKLPFLLRRFNPIPPTGNRLIFRTADRFGNTYRQVWGKGPNRNNALITYFKEDIPMRPLSVKK